MEESRFAVGRKVLGRYTLVDPLAVGGMSDIWLAENDATGAEVVLKIARGCDVGVDESIVARERFRNEARVCARLVHRNIVRVFDLLEEEDGSLILVMERLHGCTLMELLETHGKLAPAAAVAVACAVLSGLEHAHRAGVIHRDIKPENVFLAIEADSVVTPKLLDFGVAKFPQSKDSLTANGLILGTPQYMSPEQIRAQPLDPRSDLFSIGTLLHESLSGVSPFDGPTTAAQLAAVLECTPSRMDGVSDALWAVVDRSLQKVAVKRPESAAALATELREAVGLTDAELASALEPLVPRRSVAPSSARPIVLVIGPRGSRTAPTLASHETPSGVVAEPVPARRLALRRGVLYTSGVAIVVATVALLLMPDGSDASAAANPVATTPLPSSMPLSSTSATSAVVPSAKPTAAGDDRPVEPPRPTVTKKLRDRVALTPGF